MPPPDPDGAVRLSNLDNSFRGFAASDRFVVYKGRLLGKVYARDLARGLEREVGVRGGTIDALALDGALLALDTSRCRADACVHSLTTVDLDSCEVREHGTRLQAEMGGLEYREVGLDAGRVIWSDFATGLHHVWLLDLATGEKRSVSEEGAWSAFAPHLAGDWAVYSQAFREQSRSAALMLYHVPTGERRVIVQNTDEKRTPRTNGRVVVWSARPEAVRGAEPGTGADLFLYDIESGVTSPLVVERADQINPWLQDDYLVWTDLRDGAVTGSGAIVSSDIYGMKLGGRAQARLTHYPRPRLQAQLGGHVLVWLDIGTEWTEVWGLGVAPSAP